VQVVVAAVQVVVAAVQVVVAAVQVVVAAVQVVVAAVQLVQVQMEGVRQVQLRLVRHVPAHGLLEHLLEIRLRSLRPIKLIQETYENFDAP